MGLKFGKSVVTSVLLWDSIDQYYPSLWTPLRLVSYIAVAQYRCLIDLAVQLGYTALGNPADILLPGRPLPLPQWGHAAEFGRHYIISMSTFYCT